MMKFMLQVDNDNIISYDFVLSTKDAIKYQNWIESSSFIEPSYNENIFEFKTLDQIVEIGSSEYLREKYKDFIPVGSIEFVQEFICSVVFNDHSDRTRVTPINVPECLMNWSKETAIRLNGSPIVERINFSKGKDKIDEGLKNLFKKDRNGWCFVKSNDVLKSNLNGAYTISEFNKLPEGNYQISTIINDIQAEFRCFVYQDKLLDVRRYLGDYRNNPDIGQIEEMVSKYKWDNGKGPAPIAYTLDVCSIGEDPDNLITEVIECHEFFSCGLYGFNDYEHLTFMLYRTFKDIIKNIKNK